jgi:hypothetical protein
MLTLANDVGETNHLNAEHSDIFARLSAGSGGHVPGRGLSQLGAFASRAIGAARFPCE